jgi:hypothetical protein
VLLLLRLRRLLLRRKAGHLHAGPYSAAVLLSLRSLHGVVLLPLGVALHATHRLLLVGAEAGRAVVDDLLAMAIGAIALRQHRSHVRVLLRRPLQCQRNVDFKSHESWSLSFWRVTLANATIGAAVCDRHQRMPTAMQGARDQRSNAAAYLIGVDVQRSRPASRFGLGAAAIAASPPLLRQAECG